ncbi:hypothetical protein GCM10008906_22560 [Clostridium oceanicum]|uniref:Uncharacterized protein n=1 Tax=Clostridium oceanicum TaxID=1543 RepID=A0ABP3UTT4_9CLOT
MLFQFLNPFKTNPTKFSSQNAPIQRVGTYPVLLKVKYISDLDGFIKKYSDIIISECEILNIQREYYEETDRDEKEQ